jgi:hypothetical protein
MTTYVNDAVSVVNHVSSDDYAEVWQPCGVTTLLQRLEWLVNNRATSQRDLSRKAGLSGPHVGTFMARLRKDPSATVETETLMAIARGGQVSFDWLATGKGSPDAIGMTPKPGSVKTGGDDTRRDWAPEHIEEWVGDAIRLHPERRHTGRQIMATKTFLRDMTPLLPSDANMVAFAASVLEKVATIDDAGHELDPGTVFYYGFRSDAAKAEERPTGSRSRADIEADNELRAHGVEPPGWRGPASKRETTTADHTPKPPSSASKKKR